MKDIAKLFPFVVVALIAFVLGWRSGKIDTDVKYHRLYPNLDTAYERGEKDGYRDGKRAGQEECRAKYGVPVTIEAIYKVKSTTYWADSEPRLYLLEREEE